MNEMVNVGTDAVRIQLVMNTLENMSIPPTQDNVTRMAGIYHVLTEIRDRLAAQEEGKDGKAEDG